MDEGGITFSGMSEAITGTLPEINLDSGGSDGQNSPWTVYTWEAGEYFYMLGTSDSSLTEADLEAMLP